MSTSTEFSPETKARLTNAFADVNERTAARAAREPEKVAAELAAEKLLVASSVIRRGTVRHKPISVARHLAEMLRQVPIIAVVLPTAGLERRCQELADAYETGNGVLAKEVTAWIEDFLKTLCS